MTNLQELEELRDALQDLEDANHALDNAITEVEEANKWKDSRFKKVVECQNRLTAIKEKYGQN